MADGIRHAKHKQSTDQRSHQHRSPHKHKPKYKSHSGRHASDSQSDSDGTNRQSHLHKRSESRAKDTPRDSCRRSSNERFKKDKSAKYISRDRSSSKEKTDEKLSQHHRKSHLSSKSAEPQMDREQAAGRGSETVLWNFDWEGQKRRLDKIFFSDDDVIKSGTSECDDFWIFLVKYVTFQKRHASSESENAESAQFHTSGDADIPHQYKKHYRINLSIVTKDMDSLWKLHQKNLRGGGLTPSRLTQFKSIILYYLDFVQKQKFAKLVKIHKDQQNLPIYQYKEQIVHTIQENQVVVVAGDTGCGKSTQVPQYLLEAGFTNIACTQPRRIACMSLSKRVSFETFNEYGSDVAYQVRFEKSRTASTRILFLTEGLLLRQMGTDSLLEQYSVVVIDEVHERHIHTDFLLGVLRCVLLQRPDLKVVLMSATINISLFSNYFQGAPVVKIPGRLYPIQLHYVPLTEEDREMKKGKLDPTHYIRVLQAIDKKYTEKERGDVLMFLSGMSEIMSVVEAAREYGQKTKSWIILPLHSSLSIQDQDKVFDIAPEGIRKCIVSTNIAETSVTIDGVRFVVDSGKVKEMSFDVKYKMQRLQEFWISRASAEQRKGRAGRTGPGVCYRLYDESDCDALQEYSTPEIHRVPLHSLILQMVSMGLPDARKFPFLEPPDPGSIEVSIAFLKEQAAMTGEEELTPIGQMLSQLPVDIGIGKMLIMSTLFQMVDPILSIAAGLSVPSPYTNRGQREYECVQARKDMESKHGDPFTLLNLFNEWLKIKAEGPLSKKWCQRKGLEQQRFYEMSKLKKQFQELLKDYCLMAEGAKQGATAEERRKFHVDRKRLRHLRHQHERGNKKRKVLKYEEETWELEGASGEEDSNLDSSIKDLEFRVQNDLTKMQSSSNDETDVNVLKVILVSGLYPQLAIADDSNSSKPDSEQLYHTRSKGFVLLHPSSVFAAHPDLLQLSEHDIKEEADDKVTTARGCLSNKHSLLAFVSLLETNKPYLNGTVQVPALQTLLLFCTSLDTNLECTRVVCDGWLEVMFDKAEDAETMLSSAVKLRTTWTQLLELRLKATDNKSDEPDDKLDRKTSRVQHVLTKKLVKFLECDVFYYLRRVLAAEAQRLYKPTIKAAEEVAAGEGNSTSAVMLELLRGGGKPHPTKGGTQVNNYLTYDCLEDDATSSLWNEYTSCMQRHWTCEQCNLSLVVTMAQRLQHEEQCQALTLTGKESEELDTKNAEEDTLNALRKPYKCNVCKGHFEFTTSEIFRHKKSCK